MFRVFVSCFQEQLEKEAQLRQELENRLSKESSSTDGHSKEVATAKVPVLLYHSCIDC